MVPPSPLLAPLSHCSGLPSLLPLCGVGRLGLGRRPGRLVPLPLIVRRRRSLSVRQGGSRRRVDGLAMRQTGREIFLAPFARSSRLWQKISCSWREGENGDGRNFSCRCGGGPSFLPSALGPAARPPLPYVTRRRHGRGSRERRPRRRAPRHLPF